MSEATCTTDRVCDPPVKASSDGASLRPNDPTSAVFVTPLTEYERRTGVVPRKPLGGVISTVYSPTGASKENLP